MGTRLRSRRRIGPGVAALAGGFNLIRSSDQAGARRAVVALLALLLSAACGGRGSPTAIPTSGPGAIAFTEVNVIPMTPGGGVLRGQSVVVRDGRIVEIAAAGDVRIPPDAQRVDGRGRYLMPGLADLHVHLEHSRDSAMLALFVSNGVTTVRSMDGRPYIVRWRDDVARGALLGPTIYTAGPILDGDPPFFPDNLRLATPAAGRSAVVRQSAAGYDFVKTYINLSPSVFREVLEAAAEEGIRVAGHAPRAMGMEGVLEAPLWSLEHLGDFGPLIEAHDSPFRGRFHWSKLYLAMPVDSVLVEDAARRFAATGTWVVPTLVERERNLADARTVERWLADTAMARMPPELIEHWQSHIQRASARMDEADWRLIERGRENRFALLRALHRAGVPLLVGSDTPNPFVLPGAAVHDEIAAFVAAGLTPEAALAAATREAARFLGQLEEWGTVEVGKRADLLLLEANPLQEIAATRRPIGVVVRGLWLPVD